VAAPDDLDAVAEPSDVAGDADDASRSADAHPKTGTKKPTMTSITSQRFITFLLPSAILRLPRDGLKIRSAHNHSDAGRRQQVTGHRI